jgi:hypothetical protein
MLLSLVAPLLTPPAIVAPPSPPYHFRPTAFYTAVSDQQSQREGRHQRSRRNQPIVSGSITSPGHIP